MNLLEHLKLLTEDIKGIKLGKVIKNNDPKELKRVKVRVNGIYSEPIKKDHIPWALPLLDTKVPQLGDYAIVFFQEEDIYRPVYLTGKMLEDGQRDVIKTLYQAIIDAKKSAVNIGVVVDSTTFDEPATEATNDLKFDKDIELIPEDVATEDGEKVNLGSPAKGILTEKDNRKDKERISSNHPSGTFVEIHKDGTVVLHGVKDLVEIVDGENNKLVKGVSKKRYEGDVNMEFKGNVKIKIGQARLDIDQAGNIDIDSGSGKVQIKGTTLQVNGTVVPDGTGPFCGLPIDPFTGAPQTGKISSGN